jgi:hypothetical protein
MMRFPKSSYEVLRLSLRSTTCRISISREACMLMDNGVKISEQWAQHVRDISSGVEPGSADDIYFPATVFFG